MGNINKNSYIKKYFKCEKDIGNINENSYIDH